MKIFLSYPSDEREIVERVNQALVGRGHDVFFDRADLAPGFEYDQAIARAIADADVFVFFVTPTSVQPGRYTLTELGLAERRWPRPSGWVLPVMLRPTDIASVPAYVRAVNIFTARGDLVAEVADEVQRLGSARPFLERVWRRIRSRSGIATLVGIAALSGAGLLVRWLSLRDTGSLRLPAAIGQRSRAVAPLLDSGFVVAVANPPQLIEFNANGLQVGRPIDLIGEPVSIARTGSWLLVITRGLDGVTAFDAGRFTVLDTARLDPSGVRLPPRWTSGPRFSGDIESAIIHGRFPDVWVTTGDRDGEPALLRYRWRERTWDLGTWTVDTAGFGREAKGVRLRDVNRQAWGVRARGNPSVLYHFVDSWIRIDRFDGQTLALVRCATDIATSRAGNPIFLSCDNEPQEVTVLPRQMTLEKTWPAFPVERDSSTVMHHLLAADSAGLVAAFSEESPNGTPVRAQVFAMDSAGVVTHVLDEPGAIVRSLAVTRDQVVVALRRKDGSGDVLVRRRARLTPSP